MHFCLLRFYHVPLHEVCCMFHHSVSCIEYYTCFVRNDEIKMSNQSFGTPLWYPAVYGSRAVWYHAGRWNLALKGGDHMYGIHISIRRPQPRPQIRYGRMWQYHASKMVSGTSAMTTCHRISKPNDNCLTRYNAWGWSLKVKKRIALDGGAFVKHNTN